MKYLKFIISIFILLIFFSCSSNKNRFMVSGKITNAINQTLYLEEVGTGSVLSLDSVRLSSDGNYKFEYDGTSYPMFYRLRINSGYIPFTADSTQNIIINADNDNLFSSYSIEDSNGVNKDIKDISYKRMQTDKKVDSVLHLYSTGLIDIVRAREEVDSICENLKSYLLTNYIYKDPKSPSAYYALFQRKGAAVYFSVDDPEDEKAFAAVATSYDAFYPNAPYTPFLKDIALKAVAQGRVRRQLQSKTMSEKLHLETVDFPEIKGVDQKGQDVSLEELTKKGKVLLCFTAYSADWSPELVARLKKMKEKDANLIILDISLDKDSYFYRNASHNLPWHSILDVDGSISNKYNVQQLPSLFLIKDGNLERLSF